MTAVEDEGARLRDRALRAAAAGYGARHGHPLDHPSTLRWRTTTVTVVAAAAVLACLVGLVALRTAAVPGPEATHAPAVAPLPAPEGTPAPVDGTDEARPGVDGAAGAPTSGDLVVVHVVGAVEAPGLVRLVPGARVADAVEMAGGPTAEADLAALNLARPVHDGEQIRVPVPGEEVTVPDVGVTSPAEGAPPGGARVDVNRATAEELQTLNGVGPVLAERIVAHRTTHGPFRSVDDLIDVSGIGPRVLDGLRDQVTAGDVP